MNLETLHKYQLDGLLYSQTHPTLPLTIWNYTEKVQYEGLWDEVTFPLNSYIFMIKQHYGIRNLSNNIPNRKKLCREY